MKIGQPWKRRGPYRKHAVATKMWGELARAGFRAKLKRFGRDRWVVLFKVKVSADG